MMTILIDLLRRYWKPIAVLTLLLLVWLHGDHHGTSQERKKWELFTAQQAAMQAKQHQQAEAEARKQEADWNSAFNAINAIQQESLNDAISRRDRIIASLRAGRLSFRPADCGVPQASTDSGKPEDAGESRFSGQFGEWLVSRAAKCDEVTLKLNQAVQLMRTERGESE